MTHRRTFLRTLVAGGTVALTGIGLSDLFRIRKAFGAPSLSGVVPLVHDFSVEAVLNSRVSYHSVGDDLLPDEVLANVLWAAGRAPVVGSTRRIFVATSEGVFEYDAAAHAVSLHQEGNQMSEADVAFELVVAGDSALDAGAALQYAQLASVAFWTTGTDQVASCPKDSVAQNASNTWGIDDDVQMGTCFGRLSAVAGIRTELVATPSDDSLPEPTTDGAVSFETALANLHPVVDFSDTPLSMQAIGQILWASYGCTPHQPNFADPPVGLTVASAVAQYYLTERIYLVTEDGVFRYHNRLANADPRTQDHRLERMSTDDVRAALCAAEPALPEGAPAYLVFASWEASNWSEVEAGFAGASALLQASSLGLSGSLAAVGSAGGVRSSLSLASSDVPLIVMALGNDATSGAGGAGGTDATTGGSSATGGTSSTPGGSSATAGTSSTPGGSSPTGGTDATTGGSSATGGTSSTPGGSSATGGTSSMSGGSSSTAGGASATGGTSSTTGGTRSTMGGSSAPGGSTADPIADTGGRATAAAGASASETTTAASDESGCGCQVAGGADPSRSAAWAGLATLLGLASARRGGMLNIIDFVTGRHREPAADPCRAEDEERGRDPEKAPTRPSE